MDFFLLDLYYNTLSRTINLVVNKVRRQLTFPSSFNGKKIVIWLAEDFSQNITKAKISNYSAILSLQTVRYTNDQKFEFKLKVEC